MSRLFYHVMQDNAGNLLFDVSGTMRVAGSGTVATIYGDEGLTVILPNPMTNHPSFGSFKCYLAAGSYDFYMAKSGYTFQTLTGVQGAGLVVPDTPGDNMIAVHSGVNAAGGTGRYAVFAGGTAPSLFSGNVQAMDRLIVRDTDPHGAVQTIRYTHSGLYGLWMQPSDNDTGGFPAIIFANLTGTGAGSISVTATTTSYNTSSDVRLKEFIETLVGALDVVRALRPVSFRWQADGSYGEGFLAHELQREVPLAVTGLPDEVNPDGTIKPQQVDQSKIVPWLVGALKEMAQRLEIVEAQLTALTAS